MVCRGTRIKRTLVEFFVAPGMRRIALQPVLAGRFVNSETGTKAFALGISTNQAQTDKVPSNLRFRS
jgi:hypothetical protein